ncbi:MAG: cation diffusion facilitator family transporter [Firmicutes bacterium]|nr:cation diffusion facilitator family transporter [Bacillota bacterium]
MTGETLDLSAKERFKAGERVSVATMVGNIALALAKLLAGIVGRSRAMVADAVHSASDILATAGVLASLRVSKRPADSGHPYGHGKAESVAAKLVGITLIGVGLSIALSAYRTIRTGGYGEPGVIALWAAVISIVLKEVMYQVTVATGKRIRSTAVVAEAWHHRSDALSSVGSFLGILGARLGYPVLDPVAGLVVGAFIAWMGVRIFAASVDELMDAQVDPQTIEAATRAAMSVPGVEDIHFMSTRRYGGYLYVDLRLGVAPTLSVVEGHDISVRVERAIAEACRHVTGVMVHIDPETVHSEDSEGHGGVGGVLGPSLPGDESLTRG